MQFEPTTTLRELVQHVGRYPDPAFLFVRDGLGFAADQIHGPETALQHSVHEFLAHREEDWSDLVTQYHARQLPESLLEAIDAGGGCEKLNRHISGRELCWGLRDYALRRWGMLARVVLESWSITGSIDFGRIVFGFIDLDLMQRQPEDTIEEFREVYTFDEAFDAHFAGGLPDVPSDEPKS